MMVHLSTVLDCLPLKTPSYVEVWDICLPSISVSPSNWVNSSTHDPAVLILTPPITCISTPSHAPYYLEETGDMYVWLEPVYAMPRRRRRLKTRKNLTTRIG